MASEFEETVARRKKAERKKRQCDLLERIGPHVTDRMPFLDQLTLHRLFNKKDPTEKELLEATVIIDNCIAESRRHILSVLDLIKPIGDPPDTA